VNDNGEITSWTIDYSSMVSAIELGGNNIVTNGVSLYD
jgi:hypothetical protein